MFGKIKNLFYFSCVLVFLISCGEYECIEENDFGDYEIASISVDSTKTACNEEDIQKLKKGKEIGIQTSSGRNCPLNCSDLPTLLSLFKENSQKTPKPENFTYKDCEFKLNDNSRTNIERTYATCTTEVIKNCKNSNEPDWISISNDNITIKQGSKFSVEAAGIMYLKTADTKIISFSSNSEEKGIQYKPTGNDDEIFFLNRAELFNLSPETKIDRSTTTDLIPTINEFLRRGVIILKSLPDGGFIDYNGKYKGPSIEPNFSAWKCQNNSTNGHINDINSTTNYECNTDYSRTPINDYLSENNELYGMENTFEKTLGGSVVPTYNVSDNGTTSVPLINYITPQVPFSDISCALEDNNVVCRMSDNTIVGVNSGDLSNDTSITTVLKNDFLLSSAGLRKKFLYPTAVAFKVVGGASSNSSNNKCTISINNTKTEIPADGGWHLAKDKNNNGKKIILNKNNHNALSSKNKKVDIDNSKLYDVSIAFEQNETWQDKHGNNIRCGDGVVAFFMPQNEILINKSGFVSFKNLLSKTDLNNLCQQSYSCVVDNSYRISLSVINPMYFDWNEDIINNNFYENIGNGGNFQPKVETFNINFANGNWSNEIFVRKGQILRFDESNWYDIDESEGTIKNKVFNISDGVYKNLSHGLMLKIEERPALFCSKGHSSEGDIVIGFDSEGKTIKGTSNIIQCYDLENYKGAFRNLFKGDTKNDVAQYGDLSVNSYNLGARKLNNIFDNGTYGNLSNLIYYENNNFKEPYYSDSPLPVSSGKYLSFLYINNENFEISEGNFKNLLTTGKSKFGKYEIKFSPAIYYTDGQQMSVALAQSEKDIEAEKAIMLVKYNEQGNIDTDNDLYHFDSNGKMTPNDDSLNDGVVEINGKGIFNGHDFSNGDYKIFFKIIDKPETCDGENGVEITTPKLCKCANENENTIARLCSNISCGSLEIKQINSDQTTTCSRNIYANNSGSYTVNVKANYNTGDPDSVLSNMTEGTISNFINPILSLVDGTNVLLELDADGKKIPCNSEKEDDCRIFFDYKYKSIYNLKSGDKCNKYKNNGFSSGNEVCFKKCENNGVSCKMFNDGGGFLENFYKAVISDKSYKMIVKTCFALMFSFYGLYFLLGMAEFTQEDLIKKAIKISFIYLMISENGWEFYNRFFVKFFKEGIDYLTFSIAASFSNNGSINEAIMQNKLYDKSILFNDINTSLRMFTSDKFTSRIWAMLFADITGPIYIFLSFWAALLILISILVALTLYMTAQFFVSFLLAFGPIFFVLLIFEKTKGMFDKWISNLISFSLEQIFLITCISLFNSLIYNLFKTVFYYRVCWDYVWQIELFGKKIGLLKSWVMSKNDLPGLFQILLIFLLAYLTKQFVQFMADLGAKLGGGDLNSSGMTKDITDTISSTADAFKKSVKSAVKKGTITAGRYFGYETREARKESDKINKTLKKGRDSAFDTAEAKTRELMNDIAADFKLGEGKTWQEALREGNTKVKDKYENLFKSNFKNAVDGDNGLLSALRQRGMTSDGLLKSSYFDLTGTSSFIGLAANYMQHHKFNGELRTDRTLEKALSRAGWDNSNKETKEEDKEDKDKEDKNKDNSNSNSNKEVLSDFYVD